MLRTIPVLLAALLTAPGLVLAAPEPDHFDADCAGVVLTLVCSQVSTREGFTCNNISVGKHCIWFVEYTGYGESHLALDQGALGNVLASDSHGGGVGCFWTVLPSHCTTSTNRNEGQEIVRFGQSITVRDTVTSKACAPAVGATNAGICATSEVTVTFTFRA